MITNVDMGTRGPTLLSAIVPIAGFLNGEEPFDSWFNTKIDSRLEIILVLDSSDEVLSREINEKIRQSTNTKVTLLSSSARNPGETRNIGLAAATGSWICFWDSDDYPVIDQILENVIEAEENYYQISVGNYLIGECIKNHPVKFLDVQAARNLSDLYSNPGLWRMSFKRDVIKDVEFPNFRMGEDQIFLFKILATLPRIHFSSRITYKYMIYSDHQLTKSPEALRDVLLSFKKCISIFEDDPSKELAIGLYRLFITTMKIGGTRMRFSALGNLLRIWSTTPSLFLFGPHSIYRIFRSP